MHREKKKESILNTEYQTINVAAVIVGINTWSHYLRRNSSEWYQYKKCDLSILEREREAQFVLSGFDFEIKPSNYWTTDISTFSIASIQCIIWNHLQAN